MGYDLIINCKAPALTLNSETMIPGAIILGIGAGILWAAQGKLYGSV